MLLEIALYKWYQSYKKKKSVADSNAEVVSREGEGDEVSQPEDKRLEK